MSMPEETTTPIQPQRNLGWIFPLIMVLLGGAALAITYYFHTQQKSSESWPSADGVVVASYLEEYRNPEEDSYTFTPRVKYEFTVDGQRYGSQQVRFGIEQSYGYTNRALKEIEDYPVGQAVTVYYDPAEPTNAVLDRSARKITPWYIGAGSLTFIGFISLIASLKNKNKA